MRAKVLIVVGSLDRGGCEKHLLTTLPLLSEKGYDFDIFTLSHAGIMEEDFKSSGINVIPLWYKNTPRRKNGILSRLFRLIVVSLQFSYSILTNSYSIIHFFLPASYWLGAPLSFIFSNAKRVMSRRSLNDYLSHRPFIRQFESFLHRRMHFILGNSKSVVDQLIAEGSPPNKTGLIYNGVSAPVSSTNPSTLRQALGIPESSLVLVIVANLIAYKGHIDLLKAMAQVSSNTQTDWKLLIVGRDDGMLPELLRYAESANIGENVMYLGSRQDIADIYAASDIGLLVSHQEGFSNAILEGMAAGLPMVVTNVGGNAEAVTHKITGLVVPPMIPSVLSEAIQELLSNPVARKEMGDQGKKKVHSLFSLKNCVNSYDEVYKKLLSAPLDSPLKKR